MLSCKCSINSSRFAPLSGSASVHNQIFAYVVVYLCICLHVYKQRAQGLRQILRRSLKLDLRALDRGVKGVWEVGSAFGGVDVHPGVGIARQQGHDKWFKRQDKR